MNRIIAILPNTFESKREFKELRKNIINNHRVENIIALPEYSFQPYVVVNTIILNLSTEKPQEHFWKFKVKNDGYSQNKRREKKEGKNDFDIFWRFKDREEQERLKNGFQKLEIEELKKNNYEFYVVPDFSKIWEITPEEKEKRIKKRLEHTIESIEHFKESIKLQTDYLASLYQEKKQLEEYFQTKKAN